jgi:hypothetical protein
MTSLIVVYEGAFRDAQIKRFCFLFLFDYPEKIISEADR